MKWIQTLLDLIIRKENEKLRRELESIAQKLGLDLEPERRCSVQGAGAGALRGGEVPRASR